MKHTDLLTFKEIERVCKCSTALGIHKLKITGGEPFVRKDMICLLDRLKKLNGIEEITLTTNGCFLSTMAAQLRKSGITSVNVSLDTLKRERYHRITGTDDFPQVIEGIEKAMECGITVKINCAVLPDLDSEEVIQFAEFARKKAIAVRFIELMPIGQGKQITATKNETLLSVIRDHYKYLVPIEKPLGNGPAVYYGFTDAKGYVGFISAVHQKFCSQCNRVRLTSDGFFKLCLAEETGLDVRGLLRNGTTDKELVDQLKEQIKRKPSSHHFEQSKTGMKEDRSMYQIGG